MNPEETNKSKVSETQQDQDPGNPSLLNKAQQLEKDKEDILKSSTNKSGKNGG
jgi:hypothetical protein